MNNHTLTDGGTETVKKPAGKAISIRIPAPSLPSVQSFILMLLILAGILQTVQLFGLQRNIASANIRPASSVAAPSAGSSGGNSSALPTMVGGC